jgi:flagellar hook-length control protein FliK
VAVVPVTDAAPAAAVTVRPAAAAPAAPAPADDVAAAPGPGNAATAVTGAAPVAGASGSGGSTSADTRDARDQDAGAQAPATPVPGAAPAVTAPLTAQPVAPAAAAAPPPVATQLTQHVAVLRGGPDGSHSMTVVLTPENLGPVQVQVTVDRGTVDLQLRGAHEHGRAALMAALPDLRRDLESAGLTCSRLDVDRDTGGSWSAQQQAPGNGPGQQQGQSFRGETRPGPWVRPADLGESRPALTSTSSGTSTGLDVRV